MWVLTRRRRISMVSGVGMGNAGCGRGFHKQDAGRLVEIEFEGLGGSKPAEFLGLVIERDVGAGRAGDVVEQDEMLRAA